jgi:hypothetical protein
VATPTSAVASSADYVRGGVERNGHSLGARALLDGTDVAVTVALRGAAVEGLGGSLIRVQWLVSTLGGKGLLISPFHESRSDSYRMPRSSGAIQSEIYLALLAPAVRYW